jgi:hypothetical protein
MIVVIGYLSPSAVSDRKSSSNVVKDVAANNVAAEEPSEEKGSHIVSGIQQKITR